MLWDGKLWTCTHPEVVQSSASHLCQDGGGRGVWKIGGRSRCKTAQYLRPAHIDFWHPFIQRRFKEGSQINRKPVWGTYSRR